LPASPVLLIAAHGTKSTAGSATTRALVAAVAARRPDVAVRLAFLDVDSPTLAEALHLAGSAEVIVVPLLLSAGYHVLTDIPAVVAGRANVRVARHLGPDDRLVDAVLDRLAEAGAEPDATVFLVCVGSTRTEAGADIAETARRIAARTRCSVVPAPLSRSTREDISAAARPCAVAAYLLAEGEFLTGLNSLRADGIPVSEPIGVHRALVDLVWQRYDEVG
jgi:sirohydrochlorin ferrochelatase